ncbi:DUF4880 domain-containing protein [Pseudomonas sp. H9]|uniref:DUF4880 domain-containing protein n=1 Tax=Pseudomonas sp. H9 TaxID=483968 RepID=UPI001057CFE9|nr:DUF4880 domain-containing protein [Pseudomonas sp. H9]TDF80816.1 DUF4880 domain-containing protein [Pseudomonas sp. H9]
MNSSPVDEDVLEHAITWMVRLRSGDAPEELWQACSRWRAACPRHEAAWQALQASEGLFDIPTPQARIVRQALDDAGRSPITRRHALKLLGLLGASWLVLNTPPSTPAGFTTAVGQRRQLTLAEHTQLWLNTDSAIGRSSPAQPLLIALQHGQIQIAHHAPGLSPLQVRSGELLLHTRHARFDLQRLGRQHHLAMLEGNAELRVAGHPAVQVNAGQQWLIDAHGRQPLPDTHMIPGTWVEGRLVVKRIALAQLVEELGRYRHGWLQCASEVANLPVSGVFQLDDIERTLDVLSASLPVKTQRLSRLWARIVPA